MSTSAGDDDAPPGHSEVAPKSGLTEMRTLALTAPMEGNAMHPWDVLGQVRLRARQMNGDSGLPTASWTILGVSPSSVNSCLVSWHASLQVGHADLSSAVLL